MRPSLLYSLLLFCASPLSAQLFSHKPFGITPGFKLGAPLSDSNQNGFPQQVSTPSRWTAGPTVELHLPWAFSVEFDALYREQRTVSSYSFAYAPGLNSVNTSFTNQREIWDLPLMLKRRFQIGPVRPFASMGYYWSRQTVSTSSLATCLGPQNSCTPPELNQFQFPRASFGRQTVGRDGGIAGVGLEFKTRLVTISPEVRYQLPRSSSQSDRHFTAVVGFTFGR